MESKLMPTDAMESKAMLKMMPSETLVRHQQTLFVTQSSPQTTTQMAETLPPDPRQLEIQQLQREYRNMEINRRAYVEESQSILRKQQTTIDKLRKDNEGLKNDIAIILRGTSRPMTSMQQEAIQTLTDQGDKYATSIEFERKNISTMEEQIAIMHEKVLQQRKVMGGVNASKENYFMIQKQIRILENRLDKSLMRFNESIKQNKVLRDQIDDLRRERVVFENIYRKLERDLQERKRQMAEIIEVANQAYEQRDTFQMEIAAIEQANRKEQEEFDEQMNTLVNMLETELRLPITAAGLGQKAKSLTKLTKANMTTFNTSEESTLESGEMRMTRSAGALSSSPEKGGEVDFRERVQNFEEAFNKIKAATGINDIDQLVTTFIKNEEHNFSLFNYVNEQNNEIEKLEEHIQQLKEEEMKYAQESGNDVNQHKEILKDLEAKLQTADSMAEKYELRCQDLQRITESLKRGMQSIFAKIGFEGLEETGGTPPTITEINMVNYLSVLEQRSLQMLQTYGQIKQFMTMPNAEVKELLGAQRNGEDSVASSASLPVASPTLATVLGTGPKVPMGVEHLHVNPPKTDDYRSDDDDEDEDDDTRPFTRDELKNRTLNRLQKRMQGTSGALSTANLTNNPGMLTPATAPTATIASTSKSSTKKRLPGKK